VARTPVQASDGPGRLPRHRNGKVDRASLIGALGLPEPEAPAGPARRQVARHELFPRQEEANQFLAKPGRYKALYGGSRAGKTFVFIRAICMRALRRESRHAVLRLRANAVHSAISLDTLPKVMATCFPGAGIIPHRMDGYFELPDTKSQIWVGGLDDKERVDKILGNEYATIFLNEASQIPYSSYLVVMTRLAQMVEGMQQRLYLDLNPVGKLHWSNMLFGEHKDPISRQPLPDPENYARMQMNPVDNPLLSPEYIRSLDNMPEKQRRRFFLGEYIDEVDNALWTYDRLDAIRMDRAELPELRRIVVAVDPSGASGDEDERSDEIGIVVVGIDFSGRVYVLEDCSAKVGPAEWSKIAVRAYRAWAADKIVAEKNYGGAMVEAVLRAVDPDLPIKLISASRGKVVRAEPVAALYEEKIDRVRHVGRFPDLEDQLCSFSTSGYLGDKSPDRADALVWGVTELAIGAGAPTLLFG
jgi:hypothetical protein